jgi:hypothetical protein
VKVPAKSETRESHFMLPGVRECARMWGNEPPHSQMNSHFGSWNPNCYNPSLGLATKTRACKGAGQERSPRVASHAPESVAECKGMNPHTPKGAPTLGVGVPVGSWIFRERLQGLKPIGLKCSLYHWKALGT